MAAPSHPIVTRQVAVGNLHFSVDTCGSGDRFALLLHGFPESRFSWRYQLPMLAELGYTVWAPNMRGYSGSSQPEGKEAYRLPHLLDDVAGLIDAAGAKETLLIGHDWGAIVAWAFAIEQRRPLSRLVAMNVPHPGIFAEKLWRDGQWQKSWYIFFFQLPWLPEKLLQAGQAKAIGKVFYDMAIDKSRFPEDVLAHYRQQALEPGVLTTMINYYRANWGVFQKYRRGQAPVLETPTLMIWGEHDLALGLPLTEGYEGLVKDFTLHRLPGVSHWVQQEAPETVNALLSEWLAQDR